MGSFLWSRVLSGFEPWHELPVAVHGVYAWPNERFDVVEMLPSEHIVVRTASGCPRYPCLARLRISRREMFAQRQDEKSTRRYQIKLGRLRTGLLRQKPTLGPPPCLPSLDIYRPGVQR